MSITPHSLVPFDMLGESYMVGLVKGLQLADELLHIRGLELTFEQRLIINDRFRTALMDAGANYAEESRRYVDELIAQYEAQGGR